MAQKRSIFEEVGTEKSEEVAKTSAGVIDRAAQRGARGPIRAWLMVLFALVVVMITVGGLTRLTDSGLSITEWRPVTGAMPPMSAAAWDSEFAKYQEIDEFKLQNSEMSLAEFKVIYWWEWGHRQLGRVIGLVWALGFAYFYILKQIPAGWTGRLLLLGALGGAQGAIGWWMVASGLESGQLDVKSYRLATHLGLAFVILGVIAWFVLKLGRTEAELLQARRAQDRKLWGMSTGLLHMSFVQILLGALVAGIDAGRTYNDWPTMAGGFLPPEPFRLEPWWRNFFEEAGLVQFIHRIWGYLLLGLGIGVWMAARKSANGATRFAFNAAFAMLLVQIAIGVITVLYIAPLHLAILHQFGAILLWVLILRARFLSGYPLAQSVRG